MSNGLALRLNERVALAIRSRLFRPAVRVERSAHLIRLGSKYGGWTIEDAQYLTGCVAISCGLGEDASFDVEFAARYGAAVVIVDPTPRSIVHFQRLSQRIGMPAKTGYARGGYQSVEAYDLSRVSPGQLKLLPKALWIDEMPIRFYKPENSTHVSHSIKFKPTATGEDPFIIVPTVTLSTILQAVPAEAFALLKMDIEGAEVDVLNSIASWPVLPRQILVEFDVLRNPGSASKAQVERVDLPLHQHGYTCRHFDGRRNFLYVR